jgi:hypothetical protein
MKLVGPIQEMSERRFRQIHVRWFSSAARAVGGMIYLFTICEYGGGEIAWCTLHCGESFAAAFEFGVSTRLDEDVHYIVREELGEADLAEDTASVGPWIPAT